MAANQNQTTKSRRIQHIGLGVIIIGTCILWQLFLMKQIYLEKEKYRVVENNIYWQQNEYKNRKYNYGGNINKHVQIGSQVRDKSGVTPTKVIDYESKKEEQNVEKPKLSKSDQSTEHTTTSDTLLNLSLIRNTLLREAPWAESHGANHLAFLGAGMLYYSMAYSFRSETIVVLGSGGGFVPRMLKQAQRDLWSSGVRPERKGNALPSYDLYLVDAHLASAGWGSTFYAENENTTVRKAFPDIHYVFQLTDDAYSNYFRPMYDDPNNDFKIDYLHVDADHGFEQSWKDFDNYSQLLSDRAVISFHDTCYDNVTRNCHAVGVPETIEKLRNESQKRGLQMIDLHYLYRGIAFAFREHAPALETPRDRRINFCVNNADRINVTSDGFTKNGRVGSLPTLGDFMNCSQRYNDTELMIAKSKMEMTLDPPVGIMAVPCPKKGFRRMSVSGRCEKCIPGLTGENCQRSKYEAVRAKRHSVGEANHEDGLDNDDEDILHLAGSWLRSLSLKKSKSASRNLQSVMEIGPNAWVVPSDAQSSSSQLLFGSFMATFAPSSSPSSFEENNFIGNIDDIGDINVVDPYSVTNPLWIDPIVSRRYRFLPCTLKDAIDYDAGEKNKKDPSKSSPLDLDMVDTLMCLSCDDLVTMSSTSMIKEFLHSTFPSLQTIILGTESNEKSNAFFKDIASAETVPENGAATAPSLSAWKLDRDVTMSLSGGNLQQRDTNAKKRLVLLTRTN